MLGGSNGVPFVLYKGHKGCEGEYYVMVRILWALVIGMLGTLLCKRCLRDECGMHCLRIYLHYGEDAC